jgi:hypothetical protein
MPAPVSAGIAQFDVALPPNADIGERDCHVRFVPKADIPRIVPQSALKEVVAPEQRYPKITAHGQRLVVGAYRCVGL